MRNVAERQLSIASVSSGDDTDVTESQCGSYVMSWDPFGTRSFVHYVTAYCSCVTPTDRQQYHSENVYQVHIPVKSTKPHQGNAIFTVYAG